MKRILIMSILLQAVIGLSGCASAFQTASVGDDLYEIHNKTEIATRKKAEAELAKAQAEARKVQWEAKLAEANADAVVGGNTVLAGASSVNPYEGILADDYESAYARRLYGFSSPTYRMPSSYYTLRYSDAFNYATAYDPAFYNVMVSGDQVWVEPKYITSMFGTWGASVVVPSYSWYYGWSVLPPFRAWWGYPRYSWYDWCWGYPYDWWYGYPHYYHYHYHHHHYYPSYPHHGGRPYYGNIVHRPRNSRPTYIGGSTGTHGSYNGTVRRGSGTTTGSGVYRGNSNGTYRGGTSGNSGQYRSNSSNRNNNNSWNSRSDSNSFRNNTSSSHGGYSGGYSGGGNSSGGSHGGGQHRR